MGERDAWKTAAPDWEFLSMSMSMSASTFASPNPNPSSSAPKSVFRYPVLDDPRNPSPEYDTSNWTHPSHERDSDDSADKIVGHMPQQSVPSDPHVHGYGEGNISLDVESLLQAYTFMAASQDLTQEAAEALVGVSSTDMGVDPTPKKKARRSRSAKVVWTIAVTATIVGFVLLGRCLQAELYQNQQLQLELSIKDEKLDDLTHQVSGLKDLLRRHYTAKSSTF